MVCCVPFTDQCWSELNLIVAMKTCNIQCSACITLQEDVRQEFQNLCESTLVLPVNPAPFELVEASKVTADILAKDEDIVKAAREFASGKSEYLLCRNMPIDSRLPMAPKNGERPKDKLYWTSEMLLLSLLRVGGMAPLSYFEEKGDELIHQIAPVLNSEHTLSNGGKVKLGMHTDDSFLHKDVRPEFLALLCLINQPCTPTDIASVRQAYELLSAKHQQLLMQPLFRVKTPDSFDKGLGNRKILSELRPIVSLDDTGSLCAAGNLYAVECKDQSAQIALLAFGEALEDVSKSIVLQPGNLLIFNNAKVFHSRGQIREGDRYLQRVFGRVDLDVIRKETNATKDEYIFSVKDLLKM